MNVMTRIINALAFANVGNQNEFNVLLRQVEPSSTSKLDETPCGAVSARADAYSAAPSIRHAQSAQ